MLNELINGLKFSSGILFLIVTGLIATLTSSCDLINPPEPIPSYLKVDTFSFSVLPGQGSASTRITDVWVFDEFNLIGAYEMPKQIPVLDSGNTRLILSAGIWDNGISETRVPYPFYYPDTVTLDLNAGKVTSFNPHFTYRPETKFYFNEDFEAGNLFNLISGDTNMIRDIDPADVFEGGASGAIFLDKDHPTYQGKSADGYSFSSNQPVYLEMNYKCNQAFQVGLYGSQTGLDFYYYKWTVNAKDSWNKIYLNLGSDIATLNSASYQILVKAVFDSTLNLSGTHVFLDNIKLVSY